MSRGLAASITLLTLAACSGGGESTGTQPREVGIIKSRLDAPNLGAIAISATDQTPTIGAPVNFVVKAPVIDDPALVGQVIQGSWDPHLVLQGPPVGPENWSLTYFAGIDELLAAPSTPQGWASVTSVKATGNYRSDGSLNGSQFVVGTANASVPPAAAEFAGGSAGDGWNIFFSPDRGRVYNVHHHDGPATVMCRNTADGSSCGEGWPFALYHTSYRSTGYVDPTNLRMWHETFNGDGNGGWQCLETSTTPPVACANEFVPAFSGVWDYNQHIDLELVGRELYSMDALHGALTCLDLDGNNGAGAPCAGQPYAGFGGTDITYSGINAINGKIYVLSNGQISCFDPATKAACADMSWPQVGSYQPIIGVPSPDGVVRNVCAQDVCYKLDGTAHDLPESYPTYRQNNPAHSCCADSVNGEDISITKVFFPIPGDQMDCFDVATGAQCPHFPVGPIGRAYSAVLDPLNSNCLWTNGDAGIIKTWDIPTGTSGCKAPPPISTFKAAIALPRLACGDQPTISSWDSFTLVSPAPTGYTTASVTIKDSSGVDIPGWVGVLLDGSHPLNISTLSLAASGQTPTFEVNYTGLTDLNTANARFRAIGRAPELCWNTVAQAACPYGGGLLPTLIPSTASTPVTGSGSVDLENQTQADFTPATVQITTTNETDPLICGATLSGVLRGPASAPVVGGRVELLDASGNALEDADDRPIVAVSDSTGAYAFPTLLIGTYKTRISTVRDHWLVDTATVTTGGTGTTNASQNQVTSNVVVLTSGLAAKVNATFTGPVDNDNDGIASYLEKGADLDNPLDTDGDEIADYLDLDSDNDGILDSTERGAGALPRDTDEDDVPDFIDTDCDGDGIADAYEAVPGIALHTNNSGAVAGAVDPVNGIPVAVETAAGSGIISTAPNDQNNDGTPDYLSADSDGDHVSDANERGAQGLPVDTDGDETPDYLDLDSDDDLISDAVESNNTGAAVDTDDDETPDRIDLDSDGDDIPDLVEGVNDPDQDSKGNWRDVDSDGDDVLDALEGTSDPDNDNIPNYLDLDSDGDTIPDRVEQCDCEGLTDTDNDDLPDFLDLDSDGDGVSDQVEAGSNGQHPRDSDGDEKPDYVDDDSDGDEIPDAVETTNGTLVDTDNDLTPDYLDVDSDNDSVRDEIEAGATPSDPRDKDGDSVPDYRDTDSDDDGINDSVEHAGSGEQLADTDGDETPDMLDTDSDNDNILDFDEGVSDPDRDNVGNWRDVDSDGDLIPDKVETDNDNDNDNFPNYLDTDSDNDSIRDVLEAGTDPSMPRDTDGDEIPDYLDLDSDNDCLPDQLETTAGLLVARSPNAIASDNCTEPGNDRCDTELGLCTHGCAADPDCGEAASGKICDDASHACVPGCRAGSNQCQGTAVCSVMSGAGKCLVDTDGDGISDELEAKLGLNPNSPDSDNDGIPDSVEAPEGVLVDTDRDGVPDARDTDSDGDGIADRLEAGSDPTHPPDTDLDGTPNYRDTDADGDGWLDSVEKAVDTDQDGVPDYLDGDSDGDGVSDVHEIAWGTSRTKSDSDGDDISDSQETRSGATEGAIDTDGDGRPDAVDLDSDDDSLPDAYERGSGAEPADSDGDGTPDYRDSDSDNDGISDADEARDRRSQIADTDGDGTPDYLDTDSDGDSLSDELESTADTDEDGIPDFRDLDSDNDCVSDQAESTRQTQLNPAQPNALASDNCPAQAPVCEVHTGACIIAERTPSECTSDADCGASMYCDGRTRSCVAKQRDGAVLLADSLHEPCSEDRRSSQCATGACNPLTNTCATKDGDGCEVAADCASNACIGGKCVNQAAAPTVNRLSGGCNAMSTSLERPWKWLGLMLAIGLWLRRPRRRAPEREQGPEGKDPQS